MEAIQSIIKKLRDGVCDAVLADIYVDTGKVAYQRKRYERALERYRELFGDKEVELFCAPGRSEVCGNHTDHQHGHVLAASVNLDALAVCAPVEDMTIRLVSGDFPMITLDVSDLEMREEERETTAALLRGVCAGLQARGYAVGGFEAYVTSDVLMGAGLSSSAAFESLIGTILSGLYNTMEVTSVEIAQIGQYAENAYFGKPCGLMDQMACSVGGLIYIDFEDSDKPVIRQVDCDFEANAYSLCIVDTKGSHADLTDDYAAIPKEMGRVAAFFGTQYLREVKPEAFYAAIPRLRQQTDDRCVLRAMHFFREQERVQRAIDELKDNCFKEFLEVIKESGDSSCKLLQNIYSTKDVHVQNIMVALALSDYILQDKGVCRIHGGGFAGTMQAFVDNSIVERYKNQMEAVFGEGSCHVLKIRPYGGIQVQFQ